MIDIPVKDPRKSVYLHPVLQFLAFSGIVVVAVGVGSLIGAGIVWALYGMDPILAVSRLDLDVPHAVTTLWILQVSSTTIPLFIAPLFFAYVIVNDPQDYLRPKFKFPWVLLVLIFCIMFISSPLIELLANINQKMVLPHFLDGVQKWMKDSEDSAQKATVALLQMKSVWDMLFDVIVIGLFTAIAEEFMFRGVIQTIFLKWTKNTHAAIWITAILFSAFHMEFFGFLPRLLLGVLFGYFVAWSGSVWTSVWAHFINNGTAVVVIYLFQQKTISINPDDQHLFNSIGYIFSLVIVLFLLYIYCNITLNKPQLQEL